MRPYEVMIIFGVELEESDIGQRIDRVTELVKTRGGTPGRVDRWGRRTFAYELQHRTEGYYVLVELAADPATMAEVDRTLALDDAVLRHKIIRQPDHVAARSRTSSGSSRRPSGSRGPGSTGGGPGGGRSSSSRSGGGAGGAGSSRHTPVPSGGGVATPAVSAESIEGAVPSAAAAGGPSGDQEPVRS
jgi:small subunit ribosomal protein S6